MIELTIAATSVALDADGLANDVTAESGAAFTLAATAMPDNLAHKIIITPSGSVTGNYTITSKNTHDQTVSETLATDTTNAVTSVGYYQRDIVITAPSGLGAETVDIGWAAASVTGQVSPYPRLPANIGFVCNVDSGSPTYTVQHTLDGVNWFNHATVAGETTTQEGTYTTPIRAMRMSFAAAGGVTLTGLQARV